MTTLYHLSYAFSALEIAENFCVQVQAVWKFSKRFYIFVQLWFIWESAYIFKINVLKALTKIGSAFLILDRFWKDSRINKNKHGGSYFNFHRVSWNLVTENYVF